MVRASPSVLTPKEVDVHLNALKDAPLLRGLGGGRIRQLVERPDTFFSDWTMGQKSLGNPLTNRRMFSCWRGVVCGGAAKKRSLTKRAK